MSRVFVLIGVPASGKSTWKWEQKLGLAEGTTFTITPDTWTVSSDHLRFIFTGDETNQSKNDLVWRQFYKSIAQAIELGVDVIADATSAKLSDRKKLVGFCKEHGASLIHGIYFDTPLSVCKERNKNRDRIVPEYIIERMFAQLQADPPSLGDGFDSITVIR